METDRKLEETLNTIELSRQMLSVSWASLAHRELEIRTTQTAYRKLLDSYRELQQQQQQTWEELEREKARYYELQIDWETMRELIPEYEAIISMPARDTESDRLEARVHELEREKAEMVENHRNALVIAADRISASERKLDEVQKVHDLDPDSSEVEGQRSLLSEGKGQRARRRSRKAKLSFSETEAGG